MMRRIRTTTVTKRLFAVAITAMRLDTSVGGWVSALSAHWVSVEGGMTEEAVGHALVGRVNQLWMTLYPIESGWRLHQMKVAELPGEELARGTE